jgi:hypothetical protein
VTIRAPFVKTVEAPATMAILLGKVVEAPLQQSDNLFLFQASGNSWSTPR